MRDDHLAENSDLVTLLRTGSRMEQPSEQLRQKMLQLAAAQRATRGTPFRLQHISEQRSATRLNTRLRDLGIACVVLLILVAVVTPTIARDYAAKQAVLYAQSHDKGVKELAKRDYPAAAVSFEKAVRISPGSIRSNFNLGVAYQALYRNSDAQRAFSRVIDLARDRRSLREAEEWTPRVLERAKKNLEILRHQAKH